MEKHVISLDRQNVAELEVIERLATTFGLKEFERGMKRLAALHKIDAQATIQSIARHYPPR